MRGPLTYQINGFKIGTVKYLALIKVERVMPKVSCLSHEGEHRGEEKHPIDRIQVKKKRAFFKPESQSCFESQTVILEHKLEIIANFHVWKRNRNSDEDRHSNWRDSHVFLAETVHISSCFFHESKDSV